MSRACPDGHDSTSQDYCDTCGLPMVEASAATPEAASAAPAAPAPQAPTSSGTGSTTTQTCAHCGAVNPASNLFCESCGFDFTTGALPERIPLADGTFLAEPSAAKPERAPEPEPEPEPDEPAAPSPSPSPRPAPTPPPAATPAYAPEGDLDVHVDRPANRPPSQRGSSDWVVEVWIDPTWFALQESEGECPSPGPPDIVALPPAGAIIGRPSAARGVRPDIDCGTDTAVSRRHARLDTDGRRWWIEDLDSSNGTYVGGAAENPPERPITANRRVEVDADDRIYVGAWTRLVVRPATESDRRDLTLS